MQASDSFDLHKLVSHGLGVSFPVLSPIIFCFSAV